MRLPLLSILLSLLPATSKPTASPTSSPSPRYSVGELLHADDFTSLANWQAECEQPADISAHNGVLTIDTPAGVTLWFKPKLSGPVLIEFDAQQISAGGKNDRVSDTNLFWMATDTRSPADLLAPAATTQRTGKFSTYDPLRCYYAGIGGNANTTTRFRRYIGQQDSRPLLPEHDLREKADLLTPNATQHIQAVACGNLIQLFRNGRKLFELNDAAPYTEGHFAFRTTTSHQQVANFRVYRLVPAK